MPEPSAERSQRQPVHTVYGGAQLFAPDTTGRLGAIALTTLREYASDAAALAAALGFNRDLAERIYPRIVDLRSLSPLDVTLLATCARETGRMVIVHEAPLTLGMGAEIVARVMEEAFDHLEAPIARVTGWDVPYPPASLEQHYLPSVERIAEAVRRTVKY